jgi:short-subunit dehydrogenase
VVITGASSGIGKALAYELAAAGCKLVLAARRLELLEALAAELESRFEIETLAIGCDVSEQEQAEKLIAQSLERLGKIDILINNAGVADYLFFHKDSPAKMRRVMEVNYWGVVYCTHAALPAMMAAKSGTVINISSVAGKLATPGIANYSASKHALNGLSQALRMELAAYGIHVLLVCPTSTKTEIVAKAHDHSAVRFNPENYFGMSAERVAKETLQALLDKRREHVLGAGERLGLQIFQLIPGLGEAILRRGASFVFQD